MPGVSGICMDASLRRTHWAGRGTPWDRAGGRGQSECPCSDPTPDEWEKDGWMKNHNQNSRSEKDISQSLGWSDTGPISLSGSDV